MPREKFGLAFHYLGRMGFERFRDLRVQLLPSATQQAAMNRLLDQSMLEGVDRVGRCASREDQLGSDEAAESGLQLLLGKMGDGHAAADRKTHVRSLRQPAPHTAPTPSGRGVPSTRRANSSGSLMAAMAHRAHSGPPPHATGRSPA